MAEPNNELVILPGGAPLNVLPAPERPQGAFIVFPGGGYGHLADHEGVPVAQWLAGLGIASAVLMYRHAPDHRHPSPLNDAAEAVAEMRRRYDRVGVLGFSAGGHLAGSVTTHDDVAARPDAAVLCYPVVTLMPPYTHEGSRSNLLGDRAEDNELAKELSTNERVDDKTPPVFIWHTVDDAAVPVENAFLFAKAMHAHGRNFALHLTGVDVPHGVGLGKDDLTRTWMGHCAAWLAAHGFGHAAK